MFMILPAHDMLLRGLCINYYEFVTCTCCVGVWGGAGSRVFVRVLLDYI